jgi:DNA polymerase III epsilon subunit-like protein
VQIAGVSPIGEVLLTRRIKPSIPISPEASQVHGIPNELVASAPDFPDVSPQLVALLAGRDVVPAMLPLTAAWDMQPAGATICPGWA